MELEKGVCFSCDGKNPILKDHSEKIQQSFLCLYTETTLNVEKLQSILPSLKLCPICFHQLIILKKIHECIEANKHINAEAVDCVFCKKGDFTFKISKWNHLKDISDDFPVFSDENKHEICSQCCFYLDRRNFLKRRLFTKYPHLRVVPKLKLKFGSELTTHSTPLKNKSKHASEKMSDSETINISDDQSPKGLDMSSIKSFRALKNNRLLKKSNKFHDPKLLNQILYIKITKKHSHSNSDYFTSKIVMKKSNHNVENGKQWNEDESQEIISSEESDDSKGINDKYTKKQGFFKIKLKKKMTNKIKQVKKQHDKKDENSITNNFKKCLVINLNRIVKLPDKNLDGEDLKDIESHEKTEDSSKMEVDTEGDSTPCENTPMDIGVEKSETTNVEKEQSNDTDELETVGDKEASEDDKKETDNDEQGDAENNESNSSKKHIEGDDEKNDTDEEKDGKDVDEQENQELLEDDEKENEEMPLKTTTNRRKPVFFDSEEESVEQETRAEETENKESCNDDGPGDSHIEKKTSKDIEHKKGSNKEADNDEQTDGIEKDEEKLEDKEAEDTKETDDQDKKETNDEFQDKSDEIGIEEKDRNNIEAMLQQIVGESPELEKEEESKETQEENDREHSVDTNDDDDVLSGCKRKRTDSPDVGSSPEKKKKKVTFSDDVLDSSD